METTVFNNWGRFLLLIFFVSSVGWSQGLENFANSPAGTNYEDGSFVGNNGVTWTYVASRDGNGDANGSGIELPALMLRRSSDESKITSSPIPGGIGNFSLKLYKGFTGGGDRQVELFVNGISKGVSTGFDDFDEHIFQVDNINILGNVVIEIRNITSKQVIIDDISWTAFAGGGNTGPSISLIEQNPMKEYVTSSDPVLVSAAIVDVDGISSAELHWGTVSGNLNNTISMALLGGVLFQAVSPIPAHPDGTTVYYEIQATDAHASPATTVSPEHSYTVSDPVPLVLPYFNPFRIQGDLNRAISEDFIFNNTVLISSGGGFLQINNGSVISAQIDFSQYENLTVIFDMTTYGGNNGQEMKISVSNDNGGTFTEVVTIPTPSSYGTFTQLIDLSSLNGNEGRIKFEKVNGSSSIRFRDLSIVGDFEGFFYLNGNWTPYNPNGISTLQDDVFIINGTASLPLNTSTRNVIITDGAQLKIENVLTIAGNILNKGNLWFASTPTRNGELGPVPAGSTVTGNATVHRYLSDKQSYRMISSAVTTTTSIHANWQEGATSNTHNPSPGFGTHITGSTIDQENGFDGTVTGAPSMFRLNYSNQDFGAIDNTDTNLLHAGESFLMWLRGDRSLDLSDMNASSATTLRATGTLKVGTAIQNFSTVNTRDFAMFGNPYQGVVDVNSLMGSAVNVNPLYYYVYDPNLGDHGAFVTVNLTDGNGTNTSGSTANKYLQPGQAAQVSTLAPGPSSLTFNESDKAPGQFTATNATGDLMTADNMLTVQLFTDENFTNGGPVHDSFGIVFAEGSDDGLTMEDAVKPMNFYENLGIDHEGTYLSLEHRSLPQPQPSDTYWIYSSGYQSSDYVLKMNLTGLDNVEVVLEDTFTDETILMSNLQETIHNFSVDPSDPLSVATDRFNIRVNEVLAVNDHNLLSGIMLYPNPLQGNNFQIRVPNLNNENVLVSVKDMTGRSIFNHILECRDNVIIVRMDDNLASGLYLVTINHRGQNQTLRLIKN
ncbi:T9SS type A sorting domain-containing protein [Aequorivita sp. H23M31]|uniref:T9SS type A sorting domain-containing protein n=1 Tax=Aequorivita ciconiae TaxID=2494375 RepID=A0A410G266_9FLAO|nr:T9SS type A sorting domain-containing protein [Aequorivita sp. H23M31]QAA81340.1 T9SS type A sorting domain-containing protein [Aequorivita sp. H23M31]